ncbi:MAG TPA: hypothetical protein VNG51_10335 [Ktedonobacteraceae bacterium]|nr:hypothetical protein [Ktedonobacteraceae bacterium]
MKEQSEQLSLDKLNSLFAQLNPLDVEQFYTAYQLWSTRQRIQTLQAQIDYIQRDLVENTAHLEQVHPSALALATLARLQSHGVSDIVVLDCMLERGEEWLDRTVQRLEYCEKLDVISGDYTKWCEHALEGAYDWIDSMLTQEAVDASSTQPASSETPLQAYHEFIEQAETYEKSEPGSEMTEALFLQKLMSDDLEEAEQAEDDASLLETTLKISAFPRPTKQAPAPEGENVQPAPSELNVLPTEQETGSEAVESTPVLAETQAEHTEVTAMTAEQQEQPQPVLQHIEDRAEAIAQPDKALDTQEPTSINESQIEISPEQEADVPENAPPLYAASASTDTSDNKILPVPSTSSEVKQKRGVLRTLIAVLFHV